MARSPEQFVAALWSRLLPGWTVDEAKTQADTEFAVWYRELAGAPGASGAKAAQAMEELQRVLLREKSAVARPHATDPLLQVLEHLQLLARQALDDAKREG